MRQILKMQNWARGCLVQKRARVKLQGAVKRMNTFGGSGGLLSEVKTTNMLKHLKVQLQVTVDSTNTTLKASPAAPPMAPVPIHPLSVMEGPIKLLIPCGVGDCSLAVTHKGIQLYDTAQPLRPAVASSITSALPYCAVALEHGGTCLV